MDAFAAMAADLPDPSERSVPDATPEVVQFSPCCQVWKNKYSKVEKRRVLLKQAVRVLEKGCDTMEAQNLTLKKAYEEEQARSKVEKEGREKELALRVSLENQLSALKSEISNLNQKGVSDVEDKTEEIKLLKACVSDREKEINWLKELVQKEKKRADLEMKKAAESSKHAETEKGKAGEEQRCADIERKKAEDYKTQLEALRKEVSEAKSKLVSETSKLDVATKQLQEEKNKAVEERKHADLDMAKAKEQRKIAEETKKKAVEERKRADLEMTKANELRKIAEDIKKKAVEERKHADLEMVKAEEQRKIAEDTKKKAVEERKHATLEMVKAEEQRKIAEDTKKAVEEGKRADLEMAKAKEQRKIAEETKKRGVEERKHADLEMAEAEVQRKIADETMKKAVEVRTCADFQMAKAEERRKIAVETKKVAEETKKATEDRKHAVVEMAKVEVQRKIVEATKKKAVEEMSLADGLTKQLEEAIRRNEEVEKKLHELSGSKNLGEGPKRKQAESEMRKAVKKRKLGEVNTKKAVDGKNYGDHRSKQLEDARLKINELQKQIHELSSSGKMVDALIVSSDKGISAEVAEVKLLKKQLKFEKKRVKHAKDVARLEKSRNNLLQQEVGSMKLELIQFLNRLDALDKCFSTPAGGIEDMEKAEDFASMQWSELKKKLGSLKLHQTCPQTENQLLKTRCMDTTASNPLGQTFQRDAHLLLIQGENFTESITGINSKSESPLGGCNRKMLGSSAINSSTTSFSDRQLVGSQERGAFSVTTSAKLGEDNLNLQPTISSMSGEVTKNRCNENLAVVAENSVRSPLEVAPPGRVNGRGRRRKMILDAVESIDFLCCESKKLHLQLEDKLSGLHCMVKGQMDKPREEAKLVRSNLQDIAYAVHDRSCKRRKASNDEAVAMEQFCDGLLLKQMQSCPEHLCNPDTVGPKVMVGFEEVVNKNYMKLLDLDDAAEEECYRMAAKMPVSPILPVIKFRGYETFEVDQCTSVQDVNCEKFSHENENVASSDCFDVMNLDNGSNKLQCNRMELLQHENKCALGSFDILRCNKNGFCSTLPTEEACLSHSQNPGVEVEMSVVPSSGDGAANIPFESEIRSSIESIPKYCVMFSNIKDSSSVSRILCATKTCMAQCSLAAQTEFVMHRILHALKLEEKLLPKEKVCVFFSLVLLNFYISTTGKCSLIRDFKPCLSLFAEHINEVMSDAEPSSLVAELCLEELLSVIEDFLIEGRVVSYTNLSTETSVEYDSRIHVIIDGLDIIFSHEAASADMLVAGSIILGSICAAADHAGFMCEAAYNIFRMHRYDTSVALIILHVFAYTSGGAIFTLRNYSLTMTALKSIVVFLESEQAPMAVATLLSAGDAQAKIHACVGCPFSKDALSVDIVVSLLFAKLQNYAQSGIMHQDLIANSLNSSVMSIEDKDEHNLSSVLDMNCGVSCCLDKHSMPGKQSGSVVTRTLCHISDVLSLLELLACNMSWDWTCKKIISQLWSMLESPVLEDLTVAIIVLVGQLGRLGVDAVGYEDEEVENLRAKLSAFLWRETTIRAGLPIQLATVTALLGLMSFDFDNVILENVKLPVISGQFVSADLIRNWFYLLTEEQRAMSIRLFQSVD